MQIPRLMRPVKRTGTDVQDHVFAAAFAVHVCLLRGGRFSCLSFCGCSRWSNCSSSEPMIVSGQVKVKAVAAGFGGALRRFGARGRCRGCVNARVAGHRAVVVMHKWWEWGASFFSSDRARVTVAAGGATATCC
jgi:hypothetical protein